MPIYLFFCTPTPIIPAFSTDLYLYLPCSYPTPMAPVYRTRLLRVPASNCPACLLCPRVCHYLYVRWCGEFVVGSDGRGRRDGRWITKGLLDGDLSLLLLGLYWSNRTTWWRGSAKDGVSVMADKQNFAALRAHARARSGISAEAHQHRGQSWFAHKHQMAHKRLTGVAYIWYQRCGNIIFNVATHGGANDVADSGGGRKDWRENGGIAAGGILRRMNIRRTAVAASVA